MNRSPNRSPKAERLPLKNRYARRIGQVLVVGGLLLLIIAVPLQPNVAAMRTA